MKMTMQARKPMRGFTLIELGAVIAIIAVLAAFALVSFGGAGESADASMVQSAQASLQSIISQGSTRLDKRPTELEPKMVLTAVQANVGEIGGSDRGVNFTSNNAVGNTLYTMTIKNSNRSAIFQVMDNGDVRLNELSANFSKYTVDKSNAIWTIKKK